MAPPRRVKTGPRTAWVFTSANGRTRTPNPWFTPGYSSVSLAAIRSRSSCAAFALTPACSFPIPPNVRQRRTSSTSVPRRSSWPAIIAGTMRSLPSPSVPGKGSR